MPIAFPRCMAEQEPKHGNQPPPRRRVFPLLLAVLLSAGVGFWFLSKRSAGSPAQASEVSSAQSTLHLETFVLNVAGGDQRAYLRVGIDIGLNQEAMRAEEAVPVAQVRDTVLAVLGEAKVDDLLTSAGKTKLKQDLIRTLQERVPQLGAQEVYFTEFLVQR
jgi:flagellar basal body-associated protein FliL